MPNEERIKVLRRSIGALKSKLTRTENFLDKPIDAIDLLELKNKLEDLKLVKVNYEEKQSEMESLVAEEEIDNEYEARGDFEDKVSALYARVQGIINTKEPKNTNQSNALSNSQITDIGINSQISASNSGLIHSTNENVINVKLPALNLPTFSGSYEKWPGFSDVFKSSVHNDKRYTDSQKLVYLRSCLSDKAADKIESLETTDANYQVAWKILEKYYDDPTLVISNHIKAFFELPNCQNASVTSIGDLLNSVTKHYRALEALNKPFLEAFPIYAVISKLDPQTRLKWKEHTQSNKNPTMEELLEFLHFREKVLEVNKLSSKNDKQDKNAPRKDNNPQRGNNRSHQQSMSNRPASSYTTLRAFCHVCKEAHFTQSCEKLVNSNLSQRLEIIKNLNLCSNCLRANHSVENCKAALCKTCNKKHHTLLHEDDKKSVKCNFASLHNVASQILLSTAMIHILDHKGNPHSCRALLDNGSQVHFITEKMASKLDLQQFDREIPLGGVNQMTSCVSKITNATIQSRLNKYSTNLTFLLTPEINEHTPSESINRTALKIPQNIRLADPEFHAPGSIDILLGAEIFLKLLCVGQISLIDSVTLQKTHFGWILGGKIPGSEIPKAVNCNLSLNLLHSKISKFWDIENVSDKKVLSDEEIKCENHYKENTTRNEKTGKYSVRFLPKENITELGESYNRALKRFYSLERSLIKQPEVKIEYDTFMRTYQELGHMTEISLDSISGGYFMPHHAVIKKSSLTTKLRVVFDGSAKTSTGLSLNDVLMIGPTIQEDLFSLLVRFRSHAFVVTADITKMYRQVELHPDDRKYQKILWRENPDQPIKIFNLNTVTYGTAPAAFLATRTLVQLANDEQESYPNAAIALKEDFYVDDAVTGKQTFNEAKNLVNELVAVTEKGGMPLRQWASNEPDLISSLSQEANDSHICLNFDETTKTLGVYWNPKLDSLKYSATQSNVETSITKRIILSQIAQLFDPLGLLGPVILQAKILMQSLWLLELDWDESVPQQVYTAWSEFQNQLSALHELNINRKIVIDDYSHLEIHGFCDASEKAYGACIYLRSTNKQGETNTRLICSKSRVAPLKKISLPRLELCAALLLCNLSKSTLNALRRLPIQRVIFWSDSTITLHWIRTSPHKLKIFESNRVAKIQEISNQYEWRHVRTEHNPADLVSRGLAPREIVQNSFWFNGPLWINDHEENWPISIIASESLSHTEKAIVNLTCKRKNEFEEKNRENELANYLFKKWGSFLKLIRVLAYCRRFIDIKTRKIKRVGPLSPDELKGSTNCLVKLSQQTTFSAEIKNLKTKGSIDGKLAPLSPFLDSEGILRVGGRLEQSDLTYDRKHPVLLSQKHVITDLIIRDEHLKSMHAGTQATLNAIRNNYWIVDGKNAVKKLMHKCIICRRVKPIMPAYKMGDLPKSRTIFERAFKHTGIDFCGPFYIKEKKYRNRNKVKIYVAVFVCFSTKAVHLEIVSDLTTAAFLACLKRFFSRRGLSSDIYSDNATNFQGAKREILEVYEFLDDEKNINEIKNNLANSGRVNWHFIPPRAPHFGGLWEAAVKSFKNHFLRVVGERILTYEEFTTFATEVEGILNSRPLTPISSDPNDLIALTPGHFLIGDSITNVPEHNLMDIQSNRLSSWEQVQQIKQHFWSRWNKEYLNELTIRRGWHKNVITDMKIGTLVTIRDNNLSPLKWVLGRISAVHPGNDGIVRVVTVKTTTGEYKRSIKGLSPLPIDIE